MKRAELEATLRREGISPRAYSLTGAPKDEALVLVHRGAEWVVYYSERGGETNAQPFDDEDSACAYVLATLKRWPTAHGTTEVVPGRLERWWKRWLG